MLESVKLLVLKKRALNIRWVLEFTEIELVLYAFEPVSGVNKLWEKFLSNRTTRTRKLPVRFFPV
jgi:hypothetical protein